jgi:isoquinoline 1-oxidoreductase beta subunit
MSALTKVSRRDFLVIVPTAGAGLVLGVRLAAAAGAGADEAGTAGSAAGTLAPNAFLQVDATGEVTIWASKSEMGQGVRTALPMIVAEELDADWSRVRVEQAWADAKFGDQDTGGSGSVRTRYEPMRKAGAAARAMLVAAAAKSWKVPPETCRAEKGRVIHSPSGRGIPFGELAVRAAALPVPQDVALKDPKDFKIIGKTLPRTDTPSKVDGSAVYGIDVKVPGMLYAVVSRCPVFGGKMKSFDGTKAKASQGVKAVVPISNGVAVVADSTWHALKGREALTVEWNEGPGAAESTESLGRLMADLAGKPGKAVRSDGDAAAALEKAAKRIEAVYELPFQAHATMEPQNATASFQKDRCEVWAPFQTPSWALEDIARATGLPQSAITLRITHLGGGFGRRINPDYAVEAVEISKAVGAPVKTTWTRTEDLQHDFYRPASRHSMAGGLDAAGRPVTWRHLIVSTAIQTYYEPNAKSPEDGETGGADDLPYAIPNVRVEYAAAKSVVPRGYWRSVENSFNAFAVECFLDELAAAASKDPCRLRLDLLSGGRKVRSAGGHLVLETARLRACIELAAEKSGWGTPLPKGRARGIAAHFSYQSYCAQVAEVSVDGPGNVRVHRVVSAVDCGRAINPGIIAAQMEGGVVFGLTASLKSGITIDKGRVTQSNFDDYEMLRIDEMPKVETYIVPSSEPPTGVGEPGVPVVAPSIFNAIFAATGKRIRSLPLRSGDLGGAA